MSRIGTHRVLVSRPATAAAWWSVSGKTCVAAYQPKGAASLAASYVNLATPGTHNAAPGTAPSFDTAVGWTGDGTQYLNAGTLTSSSAAMTLIFRYSNWTNGDYRCGGGFYIAPLWFSATNNTHYAGSFSAYSAGGATSGVVATANQRHFFNGAYKSASTGTFADHQFSILARAGGSQPCVGSIQAYAIYSDTLSDDEIATVSAAMAAL